MKAESFIEEYKIARPNSRKLHERATKAFSADGATHASRILYPFRPYITHAKGSRKWDVDGNVYIDYVMGHGALILGHSYPAWVQAVQEQVAKGVHFGENHELEIEWAELIQSMMPVAERIEFCTCGQEANIMAIRIARVFTGRRKILRFQDNFHGWIDEVALQGSAGVISPDVTILPMNDSNAVEKELAKKEYAILMTEGGGASMGGQIPWDTDFSRAMSDLTRKYGTLWLIDEVVTGFRDHPGGWQAIVGVKPDLTVLGKCVSGGLTGGAVVGRADVFQTFNPKVATERCIRHTGTWNANPLICAAGIAACKLYVNGAPQRKAREIADYLRVEGNKILRERGISGRLYGRSIVHLYLGTIDYEPSDSTLPPTKDTRKILGLEMMPMRTELSLRLLHRGIATMAGRFFILSAAHSKKDVDQTMEAFANCLDFYSPDMKV